MFCLRKSTYNKNVDIKCSAHDAFLELPSSSKAQYRNIRKPNNIKVFGNNKTKGPKQDSKNQPLRSYMPQGGEPKF
jgi:hypothetical protein